MTARNSLLSRSELASVMYMIRNPEKKCIMVCPTEEKAEESMARIKRFMDDCLKNLECKGRQQ